MLQNIYPTSLRIDGERFFYYSLSMESKTLETLCVHGGYKPESGEPFALPIAQSTTFQYETAQELAELFDLKAAGHLYSRISNPTVAAFEDKMVALDGGVAAVAVSSGQSALVVTVLNLCQAGDSIVASRALYGGSLNLLQVTFQRLGIEVILIDPKASEQELMSAIKDNTKMLFAETISNPSLHIVDFSLWGRVAESCGIPFVVDNSLGTPALCKPLELGAHIVTYSASKYIDGHRSCIGGVIVDGGKFSWDNGKFPQLSEPDSSYHGTTFCSDYAPMGFAVRARTVLLRDLGCIMNPMNAFLLHTSLETLHLRMEKHSENGMAVAKVLQNHPKVSWVSYPGLENSPEKSYAEKYFPHGCGGVVTFGILGGKEGAEKFIAALNLVALVTHVAANTSMAIHPASTTHRQISEEQLEASGIGADLIRLSIGIESTGDILEDITQALDQV